MVPHPRRAKGRGTTVCYKYLRLRSEQKVDARSVRFPVFVKASLYSGGRFSLPVQ
jgi:hypothetical protein